MRRILFFCILWACALAASSGIVGAQTVTDPLTSGARLRLGEKLTYNVSYSNFDNAAYLTLAVMGRGVYFNRDAVLVKAHIETTEIISAALLSLNNDYESYLDPQTGQPFRFEQTLRSRGSEQNSTVDYNQPAGVAALPETSRASEAGKFDIISALYRIRALPIDKGQKQFLNVRYLERDYNLEVRVVGSETVKTNVGSFRTIVTELRGGNSGFNQLKLRLYLSNDAQKIPVLITAQHADSTIRAELVSSELLPQPPLQVVPVAEGVAGGAPATPQPPAAGDGSRLTVLAGANGGTSAGNSPVGKSATAAAGAAVRQLSEDFPFDVGEQLNYQFFLGTGAQSVGTANFTVSNKQNYLGRSVVVLRATAETTPQMEKLFTVSDAVTSYYDLTRRAPVRTEIRLQEGKRKYVLDMNYDQDLGVAVTQKGERIEMPVGTHDILSVLYALRSFNYARGKSNAVSLLLNTRPRMLIISMEGKENIELGGQRVAVLRVSLKTDDANGNKYKLIGWISDDRRRLPLRLTATTPLGTVRADLQIGRR